MPDTLPSIWSTDIGDPMNMRNIDFHCPENPPQSAEPPHVLRYRISTDLRDGRRPLPPEVVPDYIHFTLRDLSKRSRRRIGFVRRHDHACAINARNSVSP
jgi:hypothetical protein